MFDMFKKKTTEDLMREREEVTRKLNAQREITETFRKRKDLEKELEEKKNEFKRLREESRDHGFFGRVYVGAKRAAPKLKEKLGTANKKLKSTAKSFNAYAKRLDNIDQSYMKNSNDFAGIGGTKKKGKNDPFDLGF